MNSSDEITIDFDDNLKSKQNPRDIEALLTSHGSKDLWEFDKDALNCCSSLKQILMQFCNHKLFMFNLELIKPKIVSFCCDVLRKHIVFKFDINLKPKNCNMLEFIDSIQLLFCPKLTSVTFIVDQGDSLNLHVTIKLNN